MPLKELRLRRRRNSRGQALVEFSLVLLPFLTVFIALVEFTFLFASFLSVGYASHDSAQLAATYGNASGADCAVLERVTQDISAPADQSRIYSVDIFLVNTATNGSPVAGKETIYLYDGGTHPCTKPDGTSIKVPFPYPPATNGYDVSDRCNVNQGIGCSRATVDTLAVQITYQYQWMTPFPKLIGFLTGTGPQFTQTTIMRLEPVR
jgi:hypothetical protein